MFTSARGGILWRSMRSPFLGYPHSPGKQSTGLFSDPAQIRHAQQVPLQATNLVSLRIDLFDHLRGPRKLLLPSVNRFSAPYQRLLRIRLPAARQCIENAREGGNGHPNARQPRGQGNPDPRSYARKLVTVRSGGFDFVLDPVAELNHNHWRRIDHHAAFDTHKPCHIVPSLL